MAENQGVSNVTATNKDFMSPGFIARGVEQEYINPRLIWKDLLTDYVGSTERSFKKPTYLVDSSGNRITPAVSDARRSPVVYAKGTFVPKIGQDTFTYQTDATVPYTLGIDVDEDLRANPLGEMQSRILKNSFTTFAESWALHMNSEVLDGVYGGLSYTADGSATLAGYMDHSADFSYDSTDGFLCGKLSADYYWNDDGADYITDLLNIQTAGAAQAETYGFEANFDTMAMHHTILEDMILWGQVNGKSWEISPYAGRSFSRIQGFNIMTLKNVDGLSLTYWDRPLFWQSGVPLGQTVYYTGSEDNFTRWGEDAKLRMGVQDYGVDQGNRLAYVARGDYKTFLNPTSEFFMGMLEVY